MCGGGGQTTLGGGLKPLAATKPAGTRQVPQLSPSQPPNLPFGTHDARAQVRWVPYKHTNGMALYYHHAPQSDGQASTSGEFMVSTTIQVGVPCGGALWGLPARPKHALAAPLRG